VDLRPIADFEKGHVPGAKNVQMSQFDPENRALAAARSLPVVLVCKTGQTAGGAAKRLRKAGFEKVFVLDGGIGAWQQAGLPLAKGR
jgi:rhodanese-related sulfurtransferase